MNRIVSNEDLTKYVLLSSDQLILSFRKAQTYPKYHHTKLYEEVKKLLRNIENGVNDDEDDDGDINVNISGI